MHQQPTHQTFIEIQADKKTSPPDNRRGSEKGRVEGCVRINRGGCRMYLAAAVDDMCMHIRTCLLRVVFSGGEKDHMAV
jgi:hypothetical protein